MMIPERPQSLRELQLMARLKAYADGRATWMPDKQQLGRHQQAACSELHSNLTALVERCLHPLMDRVTAREMQGFTMHDSGHGLKVAHLMWHIIKPARREALSPGEIALLVVSAHLHDLGMGLSDNDRLTRLHHESDLWDKLDSHSAYSEALDALSRLAGRDDTPESEKAEAVHQIQQAQEALLCMDTRERHATAERYLEILAALAEMHATDPVKIPDVNAVLSFDGDSYKEKLIDICVSHNQDAHVLLDRESRNLNQSRFPTKYPIGCCIADTRFVAATLRLADILDFDRERTPAVLFHYLLPRSADPLGNVSVREWSKHLSISNWELTEGKIVFHGRSPSALIHHTIVEFCRTIESEIAQTHSVFESRDWEFCVEPCVEPAIEAEGYHYIPYRFSLDEERIYELLMGRSIYANPLDALRELVQNAVDACKLRDALLELHDKTMISSRAERIIIRYEEQSAKSKSASLSVIDTGVGMDRSVIENYFLKVGRSYYKSGDFLRTRSSLRKQNIDFRPISEFGIGFMSIFMLGDKVEVETASYFPVRNDIRRRILRIDGLVRLIEVVEDENGTVPRFYGTKVTVQLSSLQNGYKVPTWDDVVVYLRHVCRNIDFPLHLEHVSTSTKNVVVLEPEGLDVPIPDHLAEAAMIIPVDDLQNGLLGQIVIFRAKEGRAAQMALAESAPIRTEQPQFRFRHAQFSNGRSGVLLRGGFAVGAVPGLPEFTLTPEADARIEVIKDSNDARSLPVTNLARTFLVQSNETEAAVFKIWLEALLRSLDEIEVKPIGSPTVRAGLIRSAKWLEQYNAFQLYRLARSCRQSMFDDPRKGRARIQAWESGTGDPLWIRSSFSYLHSEIFDLILPKVSKLLVGREGKRYVFPLRSNWADDLCHWKSYIEDGVTWGAFAEYEASIADVLFDAYVGNEYLNVRYAERFSDFSCEEFADLIVILDRLARARDQKRQAAISQSDIPLLNRALDAAGDLKVSWLGSSFTLNSLASNLR